MRVVLVAVAAVLSLKLLSSCNPATRCVRATDCPVGAGCSAGFCAEVNFSQSPDDAGPTDAGSRHIVDRDGDGGTLPDAGQLGDAGLDDGR